MKRIKITILAILVLAAASGCKKWLDINEDPANPQVGSAEVLLSPIQFQMANNLANDYRMLFKYVQYWGSQAADNLYDMHGYETNDNGGSIWRMVYVNLGPNLELMIQDAVAKEKWTYAGIGYAIKAWAFQVGTDYHGPIILDQAFDTTRLFFNYQDQPDVYAKVRQWAHASLACFENSDKIDYSGVLAGASGDQIYKGDRTKWKKFVYGLLALQFGHLRNKSQFASAYADSVVKYADLSFSNASDDASLFFSATSSADASVFSPTFNLINSTSTNLIMGRITETIVKMLTGGVRGTAAANPTTSVDPRLTRMIAPSPDNIYRGVVPTAGDPATTKRIPHVWGSVAAPYPGRYLFADKDRFPIMSYSQLQFAKAEALFIQNKTAEAHTAYIKGIEGHMDFVNQHRILGTSATGLPLITATEITNYKNSSEVAQTPADLKISDIMTQKYIAQWGWAGIEQWCDLRKYDYDTAVFKNFYFYTPDDIAVTNKGKLAQRMRPRYNSEYVWNRTELEKWGALEPDYTTQKLWFVLPE